jgi:spore maturation protein CgeB
LLRELEKLDYEVVWDNWVPDNAALEGVSACFVWFYDCIRYPLRTLKLKRILHRHQIPLVAWNQDAPHYLNRAGWRLDLLNYARMLDIYATHTLIDTRRKFADFVLYFPNAADIVSYHLNGEAKTVLSHLRDSAAYQWDVSFFGGMDGKRYKEDAERAEFFAALAERLAQRGISFNFRETAGMDVWEQIRFIQASRINLNFGARCEYKAPVASGLPERCYGIPACGGFLLCDKRTHAQDDFTPGENWAEFDGLDDCVKKIEYWLAHFDLARDLAERCHAHVMSHHTYAHRAEKLHQALLAWHRGERGLIK